MSPVTINKLERGGAIQADAEARLVAAYGARNVEITNGDGTGARLLLKP